MFHLNNNNRTSQPSSLYGTQWNYPRYNKKAQSPSKVVSIPVHFVGSERNKADSATKIEKVARGFLVRKSLNKMLKMKVELDEIEKKVNDEETVKMMKKEQKERIRIAETIMNLLLRLDSVRVFHCSALRDLRKSIIKRAIVLQEFVDQIQMVGPTEEVEGGEGKCVEVEENCLEKEEVGCEEENEGGNKIEALVNEDGEVNCMEKEERGCEEKNEGGEKMGPLMNEDGSEGKCVKEEDHFLMKEGGGEDEEGDKVEALWKKEEMEEEDRGCKEENEGGEKFEALGNEENNEDVKKMEVEDKEESVGTSLVEEGIKESVDVKEEEGRIGNEFEEENCYKEEDGGNRKMLKRMMEDNEKMMEMMAQLFERNEKQTTLLTSLTQRVEQLERAFTFDKLRRKNKKRRNVDAKHRHNGCI